MSPQNTAVRGRRRKRRVPPAAWKAACMAAVAAAYVVSPAAQTSTPGPGSAVASTALPDVEASNGEDRLTRPPATPDVPDPSGFGLDFDPNPTHQHSSVAQHGITWQFDTTHTVGQYANGDWWVVGPVTLTAITPDSTDDGNGENINPRKGDEGYDDGLARVQRLNFPHTAGPGSSVVKGVSRTDGGDDDHRGELQTAAVLTVVAEPPPENGAIAFRPPYFAPDKPQYLTTDLRTDLLPALAPPNDLDIDSLDRVASNFARLQLDHSPGNASNRELHPVDNLADYGADLAVDSHFAALRLMLDDPLADKAQALINYVQYGIDLSTIFRHDSHICADTDQNCAGHGPGRALPLVFAATMLDSPQIRSIIDAKADSLPENWSVTRTGHAPTPLFGDVTCSQERYEDVQGGGGGPRTCRDPHGYIDGGESPGSYLICCMVQPWKAAVTAMHLMSGLAETWPQSGKLIEFVDRFVTFGLWTQPDPHGRFPSAHGSGADSGHYRVPLADALWEEHDLDSRVAIDWSRQ